jgi:hypothetical protein
MAASLLAAIAVLLYSFAASGPHFPRLHTSSTVVLIAHSPADGGHSHDDVDLAEEGADASDHHHADHTHEKAGLVVSPASTLRVALSVFYPDRSSPLSAGPPYGIERPPRS